MAVRLMQSQQKQQSPNRRRVDNESESLDDVRRSAEPEFAVPAGGYARIINSPTITAI